jgi:uncharacterized protein (TIGR02118 family)
MLKSVVFFKRRAGMAVEEFQHYWLTTHADVVRRLPGLRRYVQSHTRLAGYAKGEPVYDGIAEIWADDLPALRAMVEAPEHAAVLADEARFIDRATQGAIVTQEHVIKDGPVPPGAAKNVEFITRRPDLTVEAFQRHWRMVHGPLGASIPVIRRYVQSHTTPERYARGRTPRYDGIAVTWFDSTQTMRVSATTPEYAATRADEPNFIAPGPIPIIITTEHVIVP